MSHSAFHSAVGATVANDVSTLAPVEVAAERRPRTTGEMQVQLRSWRGAVLLGGGCFGMGGQIGAPDSLRLDLRRMNRLVMLDSGRRVARGAMILCVWLDWIQGQERVEYQDNIPLTLIIRGLYDHGLRQR